jgi:hypothetical protein
MLARYMRLSRRLRHVSLLSCTVTGLLACGGAPPPVAPSPVVSTPVAAAPKEKPIDTSAVPEPPGLVVVGRVTKPEALVAAVGSWTQIPLPGGAALVRSIVEEAVADVIDLSQPLDAALTVRLSRHGVDPLVAFSVAVNSYEQAKAKLAEKHRLVARDNGQFKVEGFTLGRSKKHAPKSRRGREGADEDSDNDDDGDECVLAPAPQGGRLVCGETDAVEALAPYLSRTMPREKWSSDIHVEVRPEPVRGPIQALRGMAPGLARSFIGTQSAAVGELVNASVDELVDVVTDAEKLTVDAQVSDAGVVATTRFAFQSSKSVTSRALTANRGDAPPAAFWHLPGDTDTALFGRGSDPKLFDRPRELLGNVMLEATDSAGMPEPERKVLKDLVVDRMLGLFTQGTGVYGKGFDQAAVEKSAGALRSAKSSDHVGSAEARRVVAEQIVGWHLYQVSEPVAKVGPLLKDWSSLWNRPAFAKFMQSKTSAKKLPRLRVAPLPAGVTLPKESVHLEISIPRDDVAATDAPSRGATKPPKMLPLKPYVAHVFAVPDGGATWIGFGLDGKLVAQKAAAALASAPDANTLGKTGGLDALREGKLNGGGLFTMRGFLVFTALDHHDEHAPHWLLKDLPNKGTTPIVFTGQAEGPSPSAKAGSSVGSVRISRAVIEDIVKLALSSH